MPSLPSSITQPVLRLPVASPLVTLPRQAVPKAHVGRSGCTPNSCSHYHALGALKTALKRCEVLHNSRRVAAARARSDIDPHRYGYDPHRTTSPTTNREVGALPDAAAEVPSGIILSVGEIGSDMTDTFGPFFGLAQLQEEMPTSSLEFLLQTTLTGLEDLQRRFAGIFRDKQV